MSAPHDPPVREGDVFRAFGLACRAERDRLMLAGLAEEDRQFENAGIDRALAEQFVVRLIATIARP